MASIPYKKIEEGPDILASKRFLARIDKRTDRQTIVRPSPGAATTLRKSNGVSPLVGAVVIAERLKPKAVYNFVQISIGETIEVTTSGSADRKAKFAQIDHFFIDR